MFYGFVICSARLSLQLTRCLCTALCSFRGLVQILFRPHFSKHSKTLQKHQCDHLKQGVGQALKKYYFIELIIFWQVCENCTQVSKIIIYSLNDILYSTDYHLHIFFIRRPLNAPLSSLLDHSLLYMAKHSKHTGPVRHRYCCKKGNIDLTDFSSDIEARDFSLFYVAVLLNHQQAIQLANKCPECKVNRS